MRVRVAVPADMAWVAAIYAHYVATSVATFEVDPPPPDYWHNRLAELTERNLPFLVAEDAEGDILGYSFASPWRPRPAYRFTTEDSVYVAPGQAGRGVGSALMKPLLDHCAAAGVRRVIAVIADTGSDASRALHARFGFTEAGVLNEVGYKHGRWIDTLLMQRLLSSPQRLLSLDQEVTDAPDGTRRLRRVADGRSGVRRLSRGARRVHRAD